MSKKSDALELALEAIGNVAKNIPTDIPEWLIQLGVKPGARIVNVTRIGNKDRNNKTDILIEIEDSEPIKISAKLSSAHYFGNWYGHNRFLEEFGEEAFNKLTADITSWANTWAQTATAPFVGVSICFGKRSGRTAKEFLEIFNYEDILKIVAGVGNGENVANCLYISSTHPQNIEDLITNLRPINEEVIEDISKNFKIAYRPINPLTEESNRGKNIYTKFTPYHKLNSLTKVSNPSELFKLGEFVEVEPNRINHNHVLNNLEESFNIYIPRKQKKKN